MPERMREVLEMVIGRAGMRMRRSGYPYGGITRSNDVVYGLSFKKGGKPREDPRNGPVIILRAAGKQDHPPLEKNQDNSK
ncbi:MAG: hypothetical protein PHE48_02600 [Candidatus Daviesbacteria bacterium]|nr:hypothetical protein [Candidatus Daviesbacteria bacterium]